MDKHKKARIALRKSIKHWVLDIVRPLKKGREVNPMVMQWTDDFTQVKSGAEYCALCRCYPGCFSEHDIDIVFQALSSIRLGSVGIFPELIDKTEYICPLYLTQRDICGGPRTAWAKFVNGPDLYSAQAMVKKLIKCYNEYV